MARRPLLSAQSHPRLKRHARLQFDPVRGAWAVLAPERVLWPNDVGRDILGHCDGTNDVERIIALLAEEYDVPATEIAEDVAGFLQEWSDGHLVELDPGEREPVFTRRDVVLQEEGPRGAPPSGEGLLPPIAMLAELTHRCPFQCVYCSNPLSLLKADQELETATWLALFEEAANLGVLQVHLSGGEPALRTDLEQLVAGLSRRGVYTNLITAGASLGAGRIERLAREGLDHVQLSFQGAHASTTEKIGNLRGAHAKKIETAKQVRAAGLPLTVNAPIHRHNIDEVAEFIELALALDAERLEIANVQYAGWALLNRDALMPERAAVERQVEVVEEARKRLAGILAIDFVAPDYFAVYPKPCMGGWARDAFVVAPDGLVLPCHAAYTIPTLSFERFGEASLADIWHRSPAFNAFRGTDWMREPCQSCERKEIDWGGCRCQALAIAGDAALTDPACIKSPMHARMSALIDQALAARSTDGATFHYRRIGGYTSEPLI